ncbi:MAG: trypsin-like peptidase domain-containing protein [Deltaproteobacteria bacterium]|nr:trypsin-like peptidase domain-containing protein [Deltaproteobacteria bacterium]
MRSAVAVVPLQGQGFALVAGALIALAAEAQAGAPVGDPGKYPPKDDLRRSAVVLAVERAGPAVVNVYTEEMVARLESSGDFFRDIFEPRFRRKLEMTSLGSGVIIDSAGHVLTNFHVVQRGARIKAALVDKREYEAKVVGSDPDLDLALLKLQTDDRLPFVPMADSTELLVGETVIAIGNPFGLSHTVTTGVVSALHRNIHAPDGRTYYDFVQTDASINPGNSGGPLLNINGELIGINTAIYGPGASIGIGFAIPVNRARRVVNSLIATGTVSQAYLGLDLAALGEADLKKSRLPQKSATRVVSVEPGGPAAKGGVQVGDIVLTVEGFPIETPEDYAAKMRDYTSGAKVKMQVQRDGKPVDLVIVAGEVPLELADRIVEGQLGITVAAITEPLRVRYRLPSDRGVLVTAVRGGSPGARARIKPGDVILQVNAVDVMELRDFRQVLLQARRRGEVVFMVKRDRRVGKYGFKL